MGKVSDIGSLPFLSVKEFEEFNTIGYSKKLNKVPMERQEYLNSLNKGTFKVTQTKTDNGDFEEMFNIIRVVEGSTMSRLEALKIGLAGIGQLLDRNSSKAKEIQYMEAEEILNEIIVEHQNIKRA